MPYSAVHKAETRNRIIEAARVLFNRHGFEAVTIEMVMELAGLTRGGFYNHFDSKEALYGEAVAAFLGGRGAEWHAQANIDPNNVTQETALRMVNAYLSDDHKNDIDGQCPMIALPSDIARAGEEVQSAYQNLLEAMVGLLNDSLQKDSQLANRQEHDRALSLAALCVGGMVIARTMPNSQLADDVREAARRTAMEIIAK